jgi:hypothetical protein
VLTEMQAVTFLSPLTFLMGLFECMLGKKKEEKKTQTPKENKKQTQEIKFLSLQPSSEK